MKATEQTLQQISRTIGKVADKFPSTEEAVLLTDIHMRVNQETGEFVAFDDDDNEITRSVIEQWIGNTDKDFRTSIVSVIRKGIELQKDIVDNMSILKPYSFVLEDEDKEPIAELYVVDDDTIIIYPELMSGLDEELNEFLKDLLGKDV
ncbi:MAG: hypothetical protein K2L56_06075 [Prevotella sp.]|nr:hypothetical protein [Prevotella sp.]